MPKQGSSGQHVSSGIAQRGVLGKAGGQAAAEKPDVLGLISISGTPAVKAPSIVPERSSSASSSARPKHGQRSSAPSERPRSSLSLQPPALTSLGLVQPSSGLAGLDKPSSASGSRPRPGPSSTILGSGVALSKASSLAPPGPAPSKPSSVAPNYSKVSMMQSATMQSAISTATGSEERNPKTSPAASQPNPPGQSSGAGAVIGTVALQTSISVQTSATAAAAQAEKAAANCATLASTAATQAKKTTASPAVTTSTAASPAEKPADQAPLVITDRQFPGQVRMVPRLLSVGQNPLLRRRTSSLDSQGRENGGSAASTPSHASTMGTAGRNIMAPVKSS